MDRKEMIEEMVRTSPLALLALGQEDVEIANSFLPYSVGFEVECNMSEDFDSSDFESIPNIMHVRCDSLEQRFRIPSGVAGMLCLYNISELLKLESELNEVSGIHYHIDMTECWRSIHTDFVQDNKEWILKELDKWEYKGTYNDRDCKIDSRCWVRFHSYNKTAEIRIGEMTFEYELLIHRMIHGCQIIKKLKERLWTPKSEFSLRPMHIKADLDKITTYMDAFNDKIDKRIEQLEKLAEGSEISVSEALGIIKKRTVDGSELL